MKTLRYALGSVLFVGLVATASIAQNGRTFVSGAGADTNPCSATSPCRTFGQAISVTNSGGEVIVLTSAGYGPFTINKSITIEAPAGAYAGITVTSGDGIDINAGTGTVILRGLTVNNQGSSGTGIKFNTGATLHIESCVVNGFTNGSSAGIEVAGPGNIVIQNTIARGNAAGILVDISTAGTSTVTMDQLHLDANNEGLFVNSTDSGAIVGAAIRNSSASGNAGNGILMGATKGAVFVNIESCLIASNGNGLATLETGAVGQMSISNCAINNNTGAGFSISGFPIYSRGQNTLIGNGPNIGTLTPLPGQ